MEAERSTPTDTARLIIHGLFVDPLCPRFSHTHLLLRPQDPVKRPTMDVVVKRLEGLYEETLAMPQKGKGSETRKGKKS